MPRTTQKKILKKLMRRHGRTFSDELGINLERCSPSALFRWLCAALLFSARISHGVAMDAARALAKEGWTSARKMAGATWSARTRVLNRAGYARYDESTSRMLGETAKMIVDRYGGDLRRLRKSAECDPKRERKLLKEFKGIGEVGADIFLREVQLVWPEIRPFADKAALQSAKNLGLPTDPGKLVKLSPGKRFPKLLTALVRSRMAKDASELLESAA